MPRTRQPEVASTGTTSSTLVAGAFVVAALGLAVVDVVVDRWVHRSPR
ncbi:hypothetical protein ACI797_01535 [Geodermatophilus sp. SYSU D00691]